MSDLATLQARLVEAEAALHALLTGSMEASIDYDGRQVAFTMANADRLDAYVARLKSQIAALDPTAARPRRNRRVIFG